MLIGPKIPLGELLINGNACVEDLSKKDAKKNKLEEVVKVEGGVRGKEFMVHVRRCRGKKQNVCRSVTT